MVGESGALNDAMTSESESAWSKRDDSTLKEVISTLAQLFPELACLCAVGLGQSEKTAVWRMRPQ